MRRTTESISNTVQHHPLLFQAASHTAVGQSLDLLTSMSKDGRLDLDSYDMNRYNHIVKYKTAYYSFALPVGLGMRLVSATTAKFLCIRKRNDK